jgi:nucleoside-diphosphate kinase
MQYHCSHSPSYKLAAIKLMTPSQEHLEKHYEDLKEKPFFKGLITYMGSGPVCAMVWEGRDAVKTGRSILGATNPLASAPGTIRGDYAIVSLYLEHAGGVHEHDADECVIGCRQERLPRFRFRRERKEGD